MDAKSGRFAIMLREWRFANIEMIEGDPGAEYRRFLRLIRLGTHCVMPQWGFGGALG
jgi:hypothetical protein